MLSSKVEELNKVNIIFEYPRHSEIVHNVQYFMLFQIILQYSILVCSVRTQFYNEPSIGYWAKRTCTKSPLSSICKHIFPKKFAQNYPFSHICHQGQHFFTNSKSYFLFQQNLFLQHPLVFFVFFVFWGVGPPPWGRTGET